MGDYSVATKNRFQLSILENSDDEDVDLYEMLKQEEESKKQQQKKKANETAAVPPKKNAKSRNEKNSKPKQEQAVVKAAGVNDVNAVNIQKSSSNGRSAATATGTKSGENRPPRYRQSEQRNKDFEQPPSEQASGNSNSRFGRGGGSAYRGGRGGRGGKRFDRHSGSDKTGVKPTEKREGFGGHNWGDKIESQLASTAQPDEVIGEQANVEDTTTKEDKVETEPDVEVEVEPEVQEMTLDEWKAAQVNSRSKQQFNVRQAGEGEDQSQWKSTVALESRKRTQSQDEAYEEEQDDELKVEGTRSALDKLNIKIEFASEGRQRGGASGGDRGRFNSGPRNERRGGGRGGRGRGGRGGFQGGFRNNRFSERNAAPRVDNEMEFPSLGSK